MLDTAAEQAEVGRAALDMGEAVQRANKAQTDMVHRWINFWSGRS